MRGHGKGDEPGTDSHKPQCAHDTHRSLFSGTDCVMLQPGGSPSRGVVSTMRTRLGPVTGVYLDDSVAQTKLAASFTSPEPRYCATCG